MHRIKTVISFTTIAFLVLLPGLSAEELWEGSLDPSAYLSGRFKPASRPDFRELGGMGIPVKRKQYLREEAAEALQKMYRDFRKDHPDVPFWVQSSTRNFWDQKRIWEKKWNGQTKVEGKPLNQTIPDGRRRALKILEFSSMPGTSRHHWGTDFDLNVLTNRYYEKGPGKILFLWLSSNAAKYGFCRPYTAGRKEGYQEEKWHWSYSPKSSRMLILWNQLHSRKEIRVEGFAGASSASDIAPIYVNAVAADCRTTQ